MASPNIMRNVDKEGLDYYPTPPWATRALFELYLKDVVAKDDIVWEPACGNHFMSNVIKEYANNVLETDIVYGQNFLEDEPLDSDWIITNPPFNIGLEFALKSIACANKGVAFLVRSAFLESYKRYDQLFSIHRPSKVIQFTERVGMVRDTVKRDISSAVSYSWIVWEKEHTGPTELMWTGKIRKQVERHGDYPEDNTKLMQLFDEEK